MAFMSHAMLGAWLEQYFVEIGTFHLTTLELSPSPLDWSMILGIPIASDILPTETMTRKVVSQILGMNRVKKSKRKIFVEVGNKLKVMLDPLSTSIPWKRHPNDYVLRLFFLNFMGSYFLLGEKSIIRARLV